VFVLVVDKFVLEGLFHVSYTVLLYCMKPWCLLMQIILQFFQECATLRVILLIIRH